MTPALLLRLTPFRESDAVVQLFTRDLGVISALARGARKSRRRFGGALDYFCLLDAELRLSRTGLSTLLGVELLRAFAGVRGDVERYWVGSHFLEVCRMGAKEGDPLPKLYALVCASLEALDRTAEPASLLRVFQARALAELGYGLYLDACPACKRPLSAETAVSEPGPPVRILCRVCASAQARSVSPGAFQTLRAALRLAPDRLATLRLTSTVDRELKPLLEEALSAALGARPRTLTPLGS